MGEIKVVSVLSICNALMDAGSSQHVYNLKLSKLKYSRVVKKEIRELVCLVVALINRTSTDRLKFWVKLHLYADSVMCSVHQPALETCDKYFSSLIKKCVQDSNK